MSATSRPALAERTLLDIITAGTVISMIVTAWIASESVPARREMAAGLAAAGVLFLAASYAAGRVTRGVTRVAILTVSVLLLYSYLFQAIAGLQHVLVPGWMDAHLIAWENALTGTELSLLLQHVASPPLTEWMMFSYVLYVPLLPVTALLCYVGGGERGSYDYLVNLALANVLCNAGFVIFPVAGPLFHDASRYSVSLDGGFFTWCGEWIRSNVHYPGGSLPSPHCAVGTVMIAMLCRYNRKVLRLLLPPLLTIYVATVYGRYHYASDVVTGIGVAIIALRTSPVLTRVTGRCAEGLRRLRSISRKPGAATGTLQEDRP